MGWHRRRLGRACLDGSQAGYTTSAASSGSRARAPQSTAFFSCRQLSGAPKHRPFRRTPIVRTAAVGVRQLLILIRGVQGKRNQVRLFSRSAFLHRRSLFLSMVARTVLDIRSTRNRPPRMMLGEQSRRMHSVSPCRWPFPAYQKSSPLFSIALSGIRLRYRCKAAYRLPSGQLVGRRRTIVDQYPPNTLKPVN